MWRTIEYSATGRGHLKAGLPCQDKVRTYRNDDVTVITLADGAGTAKLSHFGAEAVLDCVSKELGEHFEDYFAEPDASIIRRRLFAVVLEALEDTQKKLRCDLRDLSSTLLVAAVSGSCYFIIHIGDGVIGYLKDDEIKVATGPDNGDFANETFFTTSPASLVRMRMMKGEDAGIHGFVLMSDGTENALYNKQTGELSQGIKRIMQMTVLCSSVSMRKLLAETFEDVVIHLTQDDCSISVVVNTDAFPNYYSIPLSEKLDLLQIGRNARNKARRIRQAGEILYAARCGAFAKCVARQIHVKPKYIRRKLDYLISLGFLEKKQGIYYSLPDEVYTTPKFITKKER